MAEEDLDKKTEEAHQEMKEKGVLQKAVPVATTGAALGYLGLNFFDLYDGAVDLVNGVAPTVASYLDTPVGMALSGAYLASWAPFAYAAGQLISGDIEGFKNTMNTMAKPFKWGAKGVKEGIKLPHYYAEGVKRLFSYGYKKKAEPAESAA